ncbi:MAG: hemerythrin domain-containing protein [Hyphomicrobiaceae bacterium]
MGRSGGVQGHWTDGTDPLEALERDHILQLEVLDLIERIADTLPEVVDLRTIERAVPLLRRAWEHHMSFEDEALFPLLRERGRHLAHVSPLLDQLEHEHDADAPHCHEIADVFEEILAAGRQTSPEVLGYMLRGFFDSQRRHIAWENAMVLPLAREILSGSDLVTLQAYAIGLRRHGEGLAGEGLAGDDQPG